MRLFNVSNPGYGVDNDIWVADSIDALARTLFGNLVTNITQYDGGHYRLLIKRAGGSFYHVSIAEAEIKPGKVFSIIE